MAQHPTTPLDAAHAAHAAAPDDEAALLRFHERVLDAELLVPVAADPAPERVEPRVYDLSDGRFVLAFDRDDRLAGFLGQPSAFVALSGRRLAALLAGRSIGVALNLGAPSATLLPGAAVDWLAGIGAVPPDATEAAIARLEAPGTLPGGLADGLAAKLSAMSAQIGATWLARATLRDGTQQLLLVLAGVPPQARPDVSAAVAETVRLNAEPLELAVAFPDPASPLLAAAARSGARLERPAPKAAAPGSDPGRPPLLRPRPKSVAAEPKRSDQ